MNIREFFLNDRNKKIIGGILGVLILTASLATGVYLVKQRQAIRSEATGTAALSLQPSTTTPQICSTCTFTVDVAITTNMNVTAADIRVRYDTAKLEAKKIEASGNFLPTVLIPGTIDLTNTASGRAWIVLGALVNTSGAYPKTGTGVLAKITFAPKVAGATSISFDALTAVAAIGSNTNVVTSKDPVSVTPVPPACPTPASAPSGLTPSGNLTCSNSSANSVTFNWSAVTGATKYYLRIDDTSNSWVTCGGNSNSGDFCIDNITGTTYTKALPANKTYKWWVSAFNACGQGPVSSQVQIVVPPTCSTASPSPTASPTASPSSSASPTASPTTSSSGSPTASPTGSPGTKIGDVNGDGYVDLLDINQIIRHYGAPASEFPQGNLNNDDTIDLLDINIVIRHYGE